MPSSNPLPPKENALFKRILKCYERKLYKNGLKFAKQILSNPKYAEHGETLAMKGLTLNCLGRKEEAYEYVRRGLRNDLKSHVCWHVYGLLQRSDKKYDEAIKCYRNALKWEKDNIQILRDLSLLQIQMRDLEGYKDTRYQLFMLRSTQRASWIGFAMSYHLLKDYDTALRILNTFNKQPPKPDEYDYEHSELLLYINLILQESGRLEQALKHLEKNEPMILDKLAVKEITGDLCLQLGKYKEAEKVYADLILRNPDKTTYYEKMIEAKQITNDDDIVNFYLLCQQIYPRAMLPKRLPLNFAKGERFKSLIDDYLRRGLYKGILPLFVDVRSLYSDPEKAKVIEDLCLSYVAALKALRKFNESDAEQQPACALLWTYYFLAQHYDYLKQTENALKYIDAAIDHTPTLIELFVIKAKIFKHAGDVVDAYVWMDEAQALDTADRYVNSKCAKYMLRANLIKKAEETCAKFTREGLSAMENLNEMQCMWFQTECALAYQRLGKWGESLKKCHEIDRHFSEIVEDQFDFHTYCMRKMTLRSYVGLLRLEDVLRSHPFYFRAANCAIQVYLHLHDKPPQDEKTEQELNIENLAPAELKKLRNKQLKAKRKAEIESQQAAQAQVKREQHNKSRQAVENDPDAPHLDELVPEKLAKVENPLDQAIKFLQPLRTLAKDNIETHLLAFEIYYRKEKILLMLQSVKQAYRIDALNARVHSCIIRFYKYYERVRDSLPVAVKAVIDQQAKAIFDDKTPEQLNDAFLRKANGLDELLEGAKMLYFIKSNEQDRAISLVTDSDRIQSGSLETCTEVLLSLINGNFGPVSETKIDEFKTNCHRVFPHASAFRTVVKQPDAPAPISDDHESNGDENKENLVESGIN